MKSEQVGVKITVLILLGPVESGEGLGRCDPRVAGRIGVRRLSTLRNAGSSRRSVAIDLKHYVTCPRHRTVMEPGLQPKTSFLSWRFSCDRAERFLTKGQARNAMAVKGQRAAGAGRRAHGNSP